MLLQAENVSELLPHSTLQPDLVTSPVYISTLKAAFLSLQVV